MTVGDLPALTALGAVGVAAVLDTRRFEIPDTISVVVLVLAAVHGLSHPGFAWWSHLAAVAAMFAFGLLAFARGWLGGGDVKLLVAIAAWTSLPQVPLMFLAVSLAGGVLALILLLARRAAASFPSFDTPRVLALDAPLPYAVAIAAGTAWWAYATRGGGLF